MLNFRIFIGFDNREPIGYHVLSHSILENSSIPVTITPIKLENLKRFYKISILINIFFKLNSNLNTNL